MKRLTKSRLCKIFSIVVFLSFALDVATTSMAEPKKKSKQGSVHKKKKAADIDYSLYNANKLDDEEEELLQRGEEEMRMTLHSYEHQPPQYDQEYTDEETSDIADEATNEDVDQGQGENSEQVDNYLEE